jgi:DNA ligase-associated metallophosphoesterase
VNPRADHALDWGGRALWLCPERAAFWPDERVLFVADFHLGKAHSFRRLGVPVPGGTSEANLDRLGRLVDRLDAAEVVFLGDLLHSAHARSGPGREAFASWRAARRSLALTLVRGNHDDHAGDPPLEWAIALVDEPAARGPWVLCHHPAPQPGRAVLAGHLHPGAQLAGRARDRVRLPAFLWREDVLVLPAFGEFTGLHTIQRRPGDRCFLTDGQRVWPLP